MSRPDATLYAGLNALAETVFPKRCNTCGRVFVDGGDYIAQTLSATAHSGLKQSWDDDGNPTVELFRNCVCGSTLMGVFGDRRHERADVRRQQFSALLDHLVGTGIDHAVARQEILKLLHGKTSEILRDFSSRDGCSEHKDRPDTL